LLPPTGKGPIYPPTPEKLDRDPEHAASGHAAAAPPRSVMNSRRFNWLNRIQGPAASSVDCERPVSGIARTKHHFQPAQMMLQRLDNLVRKGIVYINMAREQERSITRFF
jgi:dihydroxyacid dehydratase/phosphogluconate dehydratase